MSDFVQDMIEEQIQTDLYNNTIKANTYIQRFKDRMLNRINQINEQIRGLDLHTSASHKNTDSNKSYPTSTYNEHNRRRDLYYKLVNDLTINDIRVDQLNESDNRYIVYRSSSLSIVNDTRPYKDFVIRSVYTAYFPTLRTFCLVVEFNYKGTDTDMYLKYESTSELEALIEQVCPHIVSSLFICKFFTSTIVSRSCYIRRSRVYDTGTQWCGWRRVWERHRSGGCNGLCHDGVPWHWEYPDVVPSWKYNESWTVNVSGYNVPIYQNWRTALTGVSSPDNRDYFVSHREGGNEHRTGTRYTCPTRDDNKGSNPCIRYTDGRAWRRGYIDRYIHEWRDCIDIHENYTKYVTEGEKAVKNLLEMAKERSIDVIKLHKNILINESKL